MFQRIKHDESGLSLVELLAVLVISSIILTLSGTLIVQAMNNYERTSTETVVRDEADLIMTTIMRDLFTLTKADVDATACPTVTAPNESTCPLKLKTGEIKFQNNKTIVLKDGSSYTIQNKNIELIPGATPLLYNATKNTVTVTFRIKHLKKNQTSQFENVIQLIDGQ